MTNAFGWCINLKKRRRKLFLKITAYEGVLSRFVGHHRSIYSICLLILNYTCDWGGGYWVLRGWSVGSLFFSATRDGRSPYSGSKLLKSAKIRMSLFFSIGFRFRLFHAP